VIEFSKKHNIYSKYLPEEVKLVLAHEYHDYTTKWLWSFKQTLNKLAIDGSFKTRDQHPSQGCMLQAIAEAGISIITYCYDPLLESYIKNELRLI
jgi:hypothetical protein